jgi:hypothetical protein
MTVQLGLERPPHIQHHVVTRMTSATSYRILHGWKQACTLNMIRESARATTNCGMALSLRQDGGRDQEQAAKVAQLERQVEVMGQTVLRLRAEMDATSASEGRKMGMLTAVSTNLQQFAKEYTRFQVRGPPPCTAAAGQCTRLQLGRCKAPIHGS